MAAEKKIAILLHETDGYPKACGYFIWGLCDVWREQGIKVEAVKGTRHEVAADLLIPHVDATILPDAYMDYLGKFPRVVNRGVRDISKRLISRNLLARGDSCEGPVIVKTNSNCGGAPDANFSGPKIFFSTRGTDPFWRRWLKRKRVQTSSDWGKINCMRTAEYQVFPSLAAVPEAVFENLSLVVERFLPEQHNGIYYLRCYTFFGDRGYCARVGSRDPVVKQDNIVSREEVPVPEEVEAFRRRLGLDFGKLDFVIRDGQAIVFDANRTPGRVKPEERMREKALLLAPGIDSLF